MQCPVCGYERIAEEACFCPGCRYQFREPEGGAGLESPVHSHMDPHECAQPEDQNFSKKEIRFIKIQLLQPACILMLVVAAGIYLASPRISQLSIPVMGTDLFYGGFLALIAGIFCAGIFYRILVFRIERG